MDLDSREIPGLDRKPFDDYHQMLSRTAKEYNDGWWYQDWLGREGEVDSMQEKRMEFFIRVYFAAKGAPTDIKEYSKDAEEIMQLAIDLTSRESEIRAVIVIHDSSEHYVDRRMVDVIASTCNIEPHFLRYHFERVYIPWTAGDTVIDQAFVRKRRELERSVVRMMGRGIDVDLPSEHPNEYYLLQSSSTRDDSLYTRMLLRILTDKVIILFGIDGRLPKTFGTQIPERLDSVSTMAKWSMAALDGTNPSESTDTLYFALPFLRHLVRDSWETLLLFDLDHRVHVDLRIQPDLRDTALDGTILAKIEEMETVSSTLLSLSSAIPQISPSRAQLELLISEAEVTLIQYNRFCTQVKEYKAIAFQREQAETVREQLQEAKESRALASSVSRLTKLAFIYIPMNFVCAVLGMNLAVFGQGTTPLWVVFVLAATVLTLTLIPIGYAFGHRLKSHCSYMLLSGRIGLRSPRMGTLCIGYFLTHTQSEVNVIHDAMIRGADTSFKSTEEERVRSIKNELKNGEWTKWRSRERKILHYLRQKDWRGRHYFLHIGPSL